MAAPNVTLVEYYRNVSIAVKHFTENYEILRTDPKSAVVRRGQMFYLRIGFDREFNVNTDVFEVEFQFGPRVKVNITNFVLHFPPREEQPKNPNRWRLVLDRINNVYVVLKIHIPANAPVGAWRCRVTSALRDSRRKNNPFTVPQDLYILFNPWKSHDSVYLENEAERNEYVLNDTGKVWLGTWSNPQGRHWIFGQFDDIALRTALFLLDKSDLKPEERGNPVLVTRAISAIVNADGGDNGLLVANYDGNYSDGTSPYAWTGSKPILEEYYNSGGAPVRYGQCWVFSAVIVTICRALGIPCRSSTVYVTAEGSNNITLPYDAFGNLITDKEQDESLWVFHAWNDVWLSRPNLPPQFKGWQIIDGTPQRYGGGVVICGPASAEAVKQGFTGYQYDTDIVFAKLNADVSHVATNEVDSNSRAFTKNFRSGKRAVTKALGASSDVWDNDLLDITSTYKYESEVTNGVSYNGRITDKSDVDFEIVDIDTVQLGQGFNLVVKVHNTTNYVRTINRYVLQARFVYQNGTDVPDGEIARDNQENIVLDPRQVTTFTLNVAPSKYYGKLFNTHLRSTNEYYVRLYAFAEVTETGRAWADHDDFSFFKPLLVIEADRVYRVGDTVDFTISFRNPLSVKLTNCAYMLEGPGDRTPRSVRYEKDIEPSAVVNIPVSVTIGGRPGIKKIVANFTSREVPNLNGSNVVEVRERL